MTELTEEQEKIRNDIIDCFNIYGTDVLAKTTIGHILFPYGLEAINETLEKMVEEGEIEGALDDEGREALRWTGEDLSV